MKKKGASKDAEFDAIAEPLRDALLGYSRLEVGSAARAAVAQRLFGPAATRTLLPQLDEIARSVRPREAGSA